MRTHYSRKEKKMTIWLDDEEPQNWRYFHAIIREAVKLSTVNPHLVKKICDNAKQKENRATWRSFKR